jgi:ArsR family transcriptional regulator
MADADVTGVARWELYRLLGEPSRLRLLALAGEEELAIGELAELLGEAQPNVSRHVKPLRQAGLLLVRKQGTRVLVRTSEARDRDAVVRDAVEAGRILCTEDGSLARVHELVAARDEDARAFFDRTADEDVASWPAELPAYLALLAPFVSHRGLALDLGTGEGRLLEVLAPVFDRVIAIDRSTAQLARARLRLAERGYRNVELVEAELDDAAFHKRIEARGGADAVFLSRVLHHAASPARMVKNAARLLAPNGKLVVLDYAQHDDEGLREQQADVWLGFEPDELRRFAYEAELLEARVLEVPVGRKGRGPDAHIDWQILVASRAEARRDTEGNER